MLHGPVMPGQANDGIGINLNWHESPYCSGVSLPDAITIAPQVPEQWTSYRLDAVTLIKKEQARILGDSAWP